MHSMTPLSNGVGFFAAYCLQEAEELRCLSSGVRVKQCNTRSNKSWEGSNHGTNAAAYQYIGWPLYFQLNLANAHHMTVRMRDQV